VADRASHGLPDRRADEVDEPNEAKVRGEGSATFPPPSESSSSSPKQQVPPEDPLDLRPRPAVSVLALPSARPASFGAIGFARCDAMISMPMTSVDQLASVGASCFERRAWLRSMLLASVDALGFGRCSWLRSARLASFGALAFSGATRAIRRDLLFRSSLFLRRGVPSSPWSRLDPGMVLTSPRLAKEPACRCRGTLNP